MTQEITLDERFPEFKFRGDNTSAPIQDNPRVKLANAVLAAAATDGDVRGLLKQINSGVDVRSYLSTKAAGLIGQNNQALVDNAVAEGRGELTQDEYDQIRGSYLFGHLLTPDVNILTSDTVVGEMHRTAAPRIMQLELDIQNRIPDTSERSWLATAGSFVGRAVEGMVTDPIQGIGGIFLEDKVGEDGFFEGAGDVMRMAEDINAALYDYNITDEEFKELVKTSLDRIDDYGFFTDENPHMIEQFRTMILQGGKGSEGYMLAGTQLGSIALEAAAPALLPVTGLALGGLRSSAAVVTSHAVSAMSSRMAGIKVGAQAATTAPTATSTLQTVLPNVMLPGARFSVAAPSHQIMQAVEHSNRALDVIATTNVGVPYSQGALDAAVTQLRNETSAGLGVRGNRLGNVGYGFDFANNPVFKYTLGKQGGGGFATREGAEKLANDLGGGTVVPGVEGGQTRWFVYNEANIPTAGLSRPTDIADLSAGGKLLSVAFRTTQYLNNILKTGEAGSAAMVERILPNYQKALGALTREERRKFDDLYKAYNNEPLYQINAETPLTRSEFVVDWIRMHGEAPSRNVIKMFQEAEELSTADYFLRANVEYRKAVDGGEIMVRFGDDYTRARPHSKTDAQYWNPETKTYMTYDDAVSEGYVTLELHSRNFFDVNRDVIEYVAVKNPSTRRLTHTDVLPYNRGAHRMYASKGGWFLRQATEYTTATGVKVGRPNTFMHFSTEAEAKRATTEFNTLIEAGQNGKLTDDLVRANNSWNPDVDDVADFDDFMSKYGLSKDIPVDQSVDGDIGKWVKDGQGWAGFNSGSDSFVQLSARNRKRGLTPLHGYGTSGPAETVNFSDMMPKAFLNSSTAHAYAAYNQAASEGLIKAAAKAGQITGDEAAKLTDMMVRGHTLRAVDSLADILRPKLSSPDAQKLYTEASTIKTALGNDQPINKAIERWQHRMVEWAAEKDHKMLRASLEFFEGKVGAGNVSNFLRWSAFNSKLGLLSADQFWVQASAIYMSGLMSSAKIGVTGSLRTLSELPAMRVFLAAPDSLRPDLAIRMHKALGFDTADELTEWALHLERSGRLAVKGTAGEENVARSAVSGAVTKATDAGLVFFNEGERINRLYSMMLARAEAKKTYGAAFNLADRRIAQEMIGRSDILTQSMTNASSAAFQKDITALPFQFLTYTRNVMEQIFTDKIISKQERMRMALGQLVMYGAAGLPGAGWLADKYAWANDKPLPTFIRYGMLDNSLELLTGVDTSVSTRLGAGEGLFDLAQGLREDPLWKIAGGPGVAVTGDIVKSTVKMLMSIVSPDKRAVVGDEFRAVLNNVSSASKITKSFVAATTGEYVSSRTGRAVLRGLDSGDAVAIALGIPIQEVNEIYRYSGFAYREEEQAKAIKADIGRWMSSWWDAVDVGDYERADALANTIDYVVGSLTPLQQDAIGNVFRTESTQQKFVQKLIDAGKWSLAQQVENSERD